MPTLRTASTAPMAAFGTAGLRHFSANSAVRKDESERGSTSALDYKLQHRLRKLPPLPSLEPPEMDASEAVSNILYNTPAPSKQPFKR